MKPLKSILLLTSLAVFAGGTARLGAQILPVNAQLTITRQDASANINGVWHDKVVKLRVTTKDLLHMLEIAYGTTFPFGAQLVLVSYGHFEVVAADGTILISDVSDVLAYSDSYNEIPNHYLFQGTQNTLTDAQNYNFYYTSTLSFDDSALSGNQFVFQAQTQEKYSQSVSNSFGFRLYQDAFTMNGNGRGYAGGTNNFFVLSGKITAAGKSVQ